MDLLSLDVTDQANAGVAMHLHGPDGVPLFKVDGETPVTITLLGQDSDKLTRIMNARGNRHMRARGPVTMTVEQGQKADIDYLVAASVGWDGIGLGEDETAFSDDAARTLYGHAWVRDQARAFIFDRARFTKASAES
ncbi:hypothetical protein ASG17_07570 [Brevundimonas sp. Leaf363]|uniref:hypothetical protein n=1 Tax=Brevundimonas sp. Leaf363 TaxID=1736353 RepID=UPI000701CE15|nr:hypothetical protein [Brevundimonas sp. Leaf363]KQS55900.1 hypothetical protein ASG17_07570 [Brevundimonas sp. Leaf363]